MTLWRVDVCGVSHRFVQAETRQEAEALVTAAVTGGLDVRAERAAPVLSRYFDQLGRTQRRNLLAAIDGLTSPRSQRSARAARRRLARQVKFDLELRRWSKEEARALRPADPNAIATILRASEAEQLAWAKTRLHDYEEQLATDD